MSFAGDVEKDEMAKCLALPWAVFTASPMKLKFQNSSMLQASTMKQKSHFQVRQSSQLEASVLAAQKVKLLNTR